MTDEQIKHLFDRFLGWTLPENFNPDGGVSFKLLENRHHHPEASPFYPMPTGTNLLDATQANAMVRYMLEGLPGCEVRSEQLPSVEAMKAAVELEIHAALGSVKTIVIGGMIQKAIDASRAAQAPSEVRSGDAVRQVEDAFVAGFKSGSDQIRTIRATCLLLHESAETRLGAIVDRCDEVLAFTDGEIAKFASAAQASRMPVTDAMVLAAIEAAWSGSEIVYSDDFDGPASMMRAAIEAAIDASPSASSPAQATQEPRVVTVGMVTAALASVGKHDVPLSSMRRREATKMIQAAIDWTSSVPSAHRGDGDALANHITETAK